MPLTMAVPGLSRHDFALALRDYERAFGAASSERHSVADDSEEWRTWDALCMLWERLYGCGVSWR